MMTMIGTLVRSKPNPLRDIRPQKVQRRPPAPPANTANAARFCHRCTHRWHGLPCRTCACSSAWVPPE